MVETCFVSQPDGDVFGPEGGVARAGEGHAASEAPFDGIAAEALAGGGGEQWVAGSAGTLPQPGLEDRLGRWHQRCLSFLAALSDGVHGGAGGERDVLTRESGEFRDPQAGLDGESEHGVVAPAGPGGLVAGVQQRVDLGVDEVGDEVALGPLGRDGEHTLDSGGVFGMLQGQIAEQRVQRGQAVVAGGRAVVPVAFEVVQKRGDQGRVEVWMSRVPGALRVCVAA